MGRAVRSDRGPDERTGSAGACSSRPEHGDSGPVPHSGCDDHAADRAAALLGRRRVDPPGSSVLCRPGPVLDRPSHRRSERLLPWRGGGDRQGDPALPRAGKRLERHRLQLSRRPFRHDLRGTLRRLRAERRRRPRARIQHRLGRDRPPRDVREHRSFSGCPGGHRRARLLASRPRPRRSHRGADVRLRRKQPLPERRSRASARGVGTQGHGLHGMSGEPAVRAPQRAGDVRRADRLAEDLRAARRVGRRVRPLPRKALVRSALGGRRQGCRERRSCAWSRRGNHGRLDLGLDPRPGGPLHVVAPERLRATGDRTAANRGRERASCHPGDHSHARGDHAQRRRAGGRRRGELPPDRPRERHRRGRGRGRRYGCDGRRSSLDASRDAHGHRRRREPSRRDVQRSRAGSHACGSGGRKDHAACA